MTDQTIETSDESRISRRNALKAAVGAGVGAVAWTGPKITAFGATPAYAAGCTFVETFDFYGGYQPTNSRSDCQTFGNNVFNPAYNAPGVGRALPEGFFFEPGYGFPNNNSRCGGEEIRISWPADRNLECVLQISFAQPPQATDVYYEKVFGPNSAAHSYCVGVAPDEVCYDSLRVTLPNGVQLGTQNADNPTGTKPKTNNQYKILMYCYSEGASEECIASL
jgi:hypothetical protein